MIKFNKLYKFVAGELDSLSPSHLCFSVCFEIDGVKQLIAALRELTRWREFGMKLGVSAEKLDAIKAGNQDTETRKRALLRTWYESLEEACWDTILDALIALNEDNLAKKIAMKNEIPWVDGQSDQENSPGE